ncbi:uncharacterized protein C13orf46 homolog [Ctenodactylus gundi]
MEKDPTMHRRHRPGPGVLPLGGASGHTKAASEGSELQRSRSVGALLQKGHPQNSIRKPRREPESEDLVQDPRRDTDNISGQTNPEEDRKEKTQGAQGQLDHDGGNMDPETEKSDSETSTKGEQDSKSQHPQEAEAPSAFVEIDLRDHTEEVIPAATREKMLPQMDAEGLSEDE